MRAAALVAVLVLGVSACTDDADDGEDAGPTTTGSAAATPTTGPPSTTTEPPTTTTCPPATGEAPAASVDLDGDDVDEVLVPAGTGASVDILELRRVDGCEQVPVLLDGLSAQFAVGGSVLLLQGLRCEDGGLLQLAATSEDGETYATVDVVYELQGDELVRVDDRSGQLTASDPALADYSRLDC